MQRGYQIGTEGPRELRREEWRVLEEGGLQIIQCQT